MKNLGKGVCFYLKEEDANLAMWTMTYLWDRLMHKGT